MDVSSCVYIAVLLDRVFDICRALVNIWIIRPTIRCKRLSASSRKVFTVTVRRRLQQIHPSTQSKTAPGHHQGHPHAARHAARHAAHVLSVPPARAFVASGGNGVGLAARAGVTTSGVAAECE